MRQICLTFIVITVIAVWAGHATASDFCTSSDIQRWRSEQDDAAIAVIVQFARSAELAPLAASVVKLINVEGRLGVCAPMLPLESFYTSGLRDGDPASLPVAVLQKFLARHGIHLDDPVRLFRGRTFEFRDDRQ